MAQLSYTVRVGSTDPLIFALKEIDPDTNDEKVFNEDNGGLAGATDVTMRLRSQIGGVTRTFATTDAAPQLYVTDAAASEVTFYPSADEWDVAHNKYYVDFKVLLGGHVIPVPNGRDVVIDVIA